MTAARPRARYAEAARALLRDTLFDSAGELLRHRPWAEVTMAEVAAAAGVSRQTLYKEFGSRQGFAREYVLRETDRFLGAVEEAIAAHVSDPVRAVAAAFEVFLTLAAADPLVRAIVAGDDDGLLGLVTNRAGPVLSLATARLAETLFAHWPLAPALDLRFIAENLIRLGVSHAAAPSGTPAETGRSVAAVFGPYLRAMGASR